jgi:long-chain acyl-CoA synthetase
VAHKLVLHKIHDVLGGRATWAISGSAPLGTRHAHFYRGLGLTVLEGYGLTENNAAASVNLPAKAKIGTVGPALPGLELKIADDGEILMRGDQLFDGYHHNPEATAEAMSGGWFHTGDVGSMDEDGYLTITGRKKEIIVTAGGKNVSPAVLEERIRSYALVGQCVVIGDAKPFIAALITIDAEALPGWLKSKGLDDMTSEQAAADPVVREHLDKAIERANKAVSRAESVRRYEILPEDLTIANGYLTPSMKVKRDKVIADNTALIESIYANAPKGD